jgi:hypothetical protein
MKIFLKITGAVLAYTLLESLLLLWVLGRHLAYDLNLFMPAVMLGQLVLIPGMAALFSCVIRGGKGWKSRTLRSVATAISAVLLVISLLIEFSWMSVWFPGLNHVFVILLIFSVLAAPPGLLLLLLRRNEKQRIQREADQWLFERHTLTVNERRWRRYAVHCASIIPVSFVFVLYLYIFQAWGLATHVLHPHETLAGYSVPVPLTWIILSSSSDNPEATALWMNGLTSSGHLPAFSIVNTQLNLTSWSIALEAPGKPQTDMRQLQSQADTKPVIRQVFPAGGETVTCMELQRFNWYVSISCLGSDRLRASFNGNISLQQDFYDIVRKITH